MNGRVPVPEISEDPATAHFWDGVRQGEFRLEYCKTCDRPIWYPRGFCPSCGGTCVDWRLASGRGAIYSFTVVHRSFGVYEACTPYVVAYVALDEGPCVLSNVVDVDPMRVTVGLPVEVTFTGAGRRIAYVFRPARARDQATEAMRAVAMQTTTSKG